MEWLRLVGSLKLYVSLAEYRRFYRALLQKRPIIWRSLLIVATPYHTFTCMNQSFMSHIWMTYAYNILDRLVYIRDSNDSFVSQIITCMNHSFMSHIHLYEWLVHVTHLNDPCVSPMWSTRSCQIFEWLLRVANHHYYESFVHVTHSLVWMTCSCHTFEWPVRTTSSIDSFVSHLQMTRSCHMSKWLVRVTYPNHSFVSYIRMTRSCQISEWLVGVTYPKDSILWIRNKCRRKRHQWMRICPALTREYKWVNENLHRP